MYSVVLMMALGTGADSVDFCRGCGCGCRGCGCGCWGCGCGCWGGCGCGCWGGCGCYGCGCYGCGCYGGYGCHGCYSYGCGGCYGCHGCHGGYIVVPAAPPKKDDKKKDDGKKVGQTSATITVSLPADAKLTIDGQATRSTSATRTFETPELEAGKEYSYTLKAEVVRDGKTFTAEKRVTVRPNQEQRVSIDIPAATVAQK